MMDLLIIAVGILLGYAIGWKFREITALHHMMSVMRSRTPSTPVNSVEISIEKIEGIFYVYNNVTKEFLVQGKTPQEVAMLLNERFPGTVFTASYENLEQTGYKL